MSMVPNDLVTPESTNTSGKEGGVKYKDLYER